MQMDVLNQDDYHWLGGCAVRQCNSVVPFWQDAEKQHRQKRKRRLGSQFNKIIISQRGLVYGHQMCALLFIDWLLRGKHISKRVITNLLFPPYSETFVETLHRCKARAYVAHAWLPPHLIPRIFLISSRKRIVARSRLRRTRRKRAQFKDFIPRLLIKVSFFYLQEA